MEQSEKKPKEERGQSEKRGDHTARKIRETERGRGKNYFQKFAFNFFFLMRNANSTNQIAGYSVIC